MRVTVIELIPAPFKAVVAFVFLVKKKKKKKKKGDCVDNSAGKDGPCQSSLALLPLKRFLQRAAEGKRDAALRVSRVSDTDEACCVCGRESGVVTEPAVSGGSAAGELAGGLKLSCGACHSPDPLIIPSLPCLSGSKRPRKVHALGGPRATPRGPSRVSPM